LRWLKADIAEEVLDPERQPGHRDSHLVHGALDLEERVPVSAARDGRVGRLSEGEPRPLRPTEHVAVYHPPTLEDEEGKHQTDAKRCEHSAWRERLAETREDDAEEQPHGCDQRCLGPAARGVCDHAPLEWADDRATKRGLRQLQPRDVGASPPRAFAQIVDRTARTEPEDGLNRKRSGKPPRLACDRVDREDFEPDSALYLVRQRTVRT
jgi:hypothetical protein